MGWGFLKPIGHAVSAVERQVNVLDDNKTAKNTVGNNTGRSTVQQAGDLGWGFLKGITQPFVDTGKQIAKQASFIGSPDRTQQGQGGANAIVANQQKTAQAIKDGKISPETAKLMNNGGTVAGSIKTNELIAGGASDKEIQAHLKADSKAASDQQRKAVSDAAQIGLTFLAPGTSKVASSVVEKGGFKTAEGKILTASATGASVGGPFGAAGAVGDTSHPLTIENFLRGAGYGIAGGALLGTAGEAAHLAIKNARPLNNEIGGVGRNVTDEEVNKLAAAKTVDKTKSLVQELVPTQKVDTVAHAVAVADDPHAIRSIIQDANSTEAPHVQAFVKQYADALQQMDSGARGGITVPTSDGGYIRTSEHNQMYRDIHQQTGRPPTKADWVNEAQKQLESGKADSFAQREYDALKHPEITSLLQQPEGYFAQDTSRGNVSQPEMPVPVPKDSAPAGAEQPGNIPLGDRPRGYLTKAQEKNNINPETTAALGDVKPQTYTPKANPELISKTKELVDKSPGEALARVYEGADTPAKYDENVAIGGHLIQKAQREGHPEEAARIAERLDIQGRELGRGVQAYAAIHKLSPEGILLYAQRKIRVARESKGNFNQETPEASGIKKQVESFKPEDKQQVQSAVKQTVNDLVGESKPPPTTGEKLAKRVDAAATPTIPKKTDTLLKELTKKVKQEYLEPKKSSPKPPLQILQETFGRADEAAKAYPEAQAILKSKYADNPKMSAALDKFFGSDLGKVPAASTTIDKAIQNELKGKKVQVMKAIYRSWAEQKQTVAEIAQSLTKEGFDDKSAQVLAKEVTDRLNKQFAEGKSKVLERLSAEAPKKARATYIEKLSKLSNVGALDKSDYIDLARAKLGLPNLKPETAAKLSELAQHIQTLPEGADKYAATRSIKQLIEENTPLSKKQKFVQAVGTSRAMLASGDVSFGGRQALAYATSHPIKFAKQWAKQFTFFKDGFKGDDGKAFDELMGQIQSHKDYHLLTKSPLAITDPFGISPQAREEQFIGSHYAEKVPAIGRLVRGSDYAFTGLANSLRANEFYAQIEHARNSKIPITQKLVDDLAEVINTSTGRGNFKFLEDHMKSLSTAMFAPRLVISRLQTFNPQYYIKLEPLARQEALRNLVSLSAFATGILTAASQVPGVQVGLNPKSADFGKVKIGDTRLDFLGGFTQYIRLGTQLVTGESISSLSGRSSQLGTGFGKKSRKDVLVKFLENKENPVVSFATTLLSGKDAVGNNVNATQPKDVGKQLLSRFVPLVIQDVADMATHKNSLNPAIGAPLALVGVGTQTYGKQDIQLSSKQQGYIDALTKNGAPQAQIAAYKDFYQSLKTTPDRTAASDQINAALKTENYDKAQQIAEKYNTAYAASFKEWAQKHGEFEDATLRKDYNANKILLTGDNIRTRLRTIKQNQLTSASLGGTP